MAHCLMEDASSEGSQDEVWVNPILSKPFSSQPGNRAGGRLIHHTDHGSTEEAASVSQDRCWTQTNLKDPGDAVTKRSKKK